MKHLTYKNITPKITFTFWVSEQNKWFGLEKSKTVENIKAKGWFLHLYNLHFGIIKDYE